MQYSTFVFQKCQVYAFFFLPGMDPGEVVLPDVSFAFVLNAACTLWNLGCC